MQRVLKIHWENAHYLLRRRLSAVLDSWLFSGVGHRSDQFFAACGFWLKGLLSVILELPSYIVDVRINSIVASCARVCHLSKRSNRHRQAGFHS